MFQHRWFICILIILAAGATVNPNNVSAQPHGVLNKSERLEWFRDLGLGMFIHWSVDSQLGSVISHSTVGASQDYLDRYFNELPKTFNPIRFDPDEWATLARLAGMRYVVFTVKHHSGFNMYDTVTNNFGIMHTPYGRDITAQIVKAFRAQGIAVGFYFSPDDFYVLYKQGTLISRIRKEALSMHNPGLLASNLEQIRELFTHYGPIDILFIDAHNKSEDAKPYEIRELAWDLQPDVVVTRGAIETPEQNIPDEGFSEPWESCFTLGTQWQYKPTNEDYKSGQQLIRMFIEIRAKGGNFLLNVGPKPDGTIPVEQEDRIRELALWNFINQEAVFETETWVTPRQDDIWFTKKKGEETVYAILTNQADWKFGDTRTFTLQSVKLTDNSRVTVLGQNDQVVEYTDKIPTTTWQQTATGAEVTVTRAQRIYNDRKWPNPIVVKITHAQAVGR